MTDYKPVSCALHSEYELAIIQRRKIKLAWCDEAGAQYDAVVLPLDLETRNHEEFLLIDHDGVSKSVRLDWIKRAGFTV
jgi:transcriptional antiterminator Rof (Rho-off)